MAFDSLGKIKSERFQVIIDCAIQIHGAGSSAEDAEGKVRSFGKNPGVTMRHGFEIEAGALAEIFELRVEDFAFDGRNCFGARRPAGLFRDQAGGAIGGNDKRGLEFAPSGVDGRGVWAEGQFRNSATVDQFGACELGRLNQGVIEICPHGHGDDWMIPLRGETQVALEKVDLSAVALSFHNAGRQGGQVANRAPEKAAAAGFISGKSCLFED